MYHYLRRVFRKQPNSYKLNRTISGLDKKHIESRRYIDPKNTKLTELSTSLKLLNIFGEGTLSKYSTSIDYNTPSVLSKANNPPPASQRNSSSPPSKSSP